MVSCSSMTLHTQLLKFSGLYVAAKSFHELGSASLQITRIKLSDHMKFYVIQKLRTSGPVCMLEQWAKGARSLSILDKWLCYTIHHYHSPSFHIVIHALFPQFFIRTAIQVLISSECCTVVAPYCTECYIVCPAIQKPQPFWEWSLIPFKNFDCFWHSTSHNYPKATTKISSAYFCYSWSVMIDYVGEDDLQSRLHT